MNIKNISLVFFLLVCTLLGYLFFGINNSVAASPEISIHNFSLFGNFKSKSIAASCGFTLHGSADEFTTCTATCPGGAQVTGRSQCGGVCNPISQCPTCPNGAINPPSCSQCPAGSFMNSQNQCVCSNGAANVPQCNICASGLVMDNNLCVCANYATNPTACNICPAGSNMVGNICTCSNNADPRTNCSSCRAGEMMDNGICRPSCPITNVCGIQSQGVLIGGSCQAPNGANANEGCIQEFDFTSSVVNPNGSVEFSWKLPANVDSRCGFVDLTTPTPRPIPGLQNLTPTTDRIRINNIQATTRFCLVCKFYTLNSNLGDYLGEAVQHQWIRVLRIGEN